MKRLIIAAATAILLATSTGCTALGSSPAHAATPVRIDDGGRPLVVRAEAGSIWAAPGMEAEPRRTWAMPARGPVEDLRLHALPEDGGYELTFRQAGIPWRGELDASLHARGDLQGVCAPIPPLDSLAIAR